jgi:hypothetical protein
VFSRETYGDTKSEGEVGGVVSKVGGFGYDKVDKDCEDSGFSGPGLCARSIGTEADDLAGSACSV